MFGLRTLLLVTLVLPLGPLAAQEVPQVLPTTAATPTPAPPASPTPTAPIIVSPTPTPTPRVLPTPGATPTPRAAEAPAARPTPTPVPRAASSPTPAPTTSPSPQPVPMVEPSPTATVATPPVIASPLPTTDERTADEMPAWPWMLGAGALLVAAIGLWLARRQRTPEDEEIGVATDADEPEAIVPPASSAAPPVAPPVAAGLALRFRPTRVGFNMLSATAEGELTIVNEDLAPVDDLRVRTALLGAHVEQDADLAAFLAEPIGRSAVPPFTLAPGEERTVRVLAAAPRATLRTMTAAGRPMFVPVLAVNVMSGGTQVAQAFAIGAERVDSAKLAPFWLDVPDRAYAEVAARPHGPAVTRRG